MPGIVAHFRAIAEATDRPIVVYNIPQRVVVNLEPDTLAQLAEIPNVTAVKQATTDPGQARRILEETDLALYAGNDDLLLPFLELGGVGGILVYTHVVGPRVRELVTRFKDGDVEGARAIDAELRPVIEALAVTTNPIPVKAALAMLGHDVGGLRPPARRGDRRSRRASSGTRSSAPASSRSRTRRRAGPSFLSSGSGRGSGTSGPSRR